MNRKLILLALSLLLLPVFAHAGGLPREDKRTAETYSEAPASDTHNHTHHHTKSTPRAIDHAPINVMGDHMHQKGEWMISLRRMRMKMQGNHIGSDDAPDSAVLATPNRNGGMAQMLRVVPQEMTMDMTMLGVMYAPADSLTLMLMTSYREQDMTLKTYNMMGQTVGLFDTKTSGIGDITLSALFKLPQGFGGKFHGNIGISLATGSIKESGTILTPMNMRIQARLPYAMQLGSGSYDLKTDLTYLNRGDVYSYGAQIGGTFRLNENNEHYRLGNRQYIDLWLTRSLSQNFSASAHLNAARQSAIQGRDPLIDKPVQSAHPSFYGGEKIKLGLGLNYVFTKGALTGSRFALEFSKPVLEDLNGPQMSEDKSLTLGFQKAF